MPELIGALLLLGIPTAVVFLVIHRIRLKEERCETFLRSLWDEVREAGYEGIDRGIWRRDGRVYRIEAHINPLFSPAFTVRLAAYSDTVHDFELKAGEPVPEEFSAFAPLLERWPQAGKMVVECWVAGPRRSGGILEDLEALGKAAEARLTKTVRGGIFTIREGFEKGCPQWHWRTDQMARRPKELRRWCVSYWHGDPYLNPGLLRLFNALGDGGRKFYLSDAPDLAFLEHAFGRRGINVFGTLVEFPEDDRPWAADHYLDGDFFGGLLCADDVPPGFEEDPVARRTFHDAMLKALRWCRFTARRLFDDEFAWYSGEYEILTTGDLDVPGILERVAKEQDAQVMKIDRRFNKRIVVPRDF